MRENEIFARKKNKFSLGLNVKQNETEPKINCLNLNPWKT